MASYNRLMSSDNRLMPFYNGLKPIYNQLKPNDEHHKPIDKPLKPSALTSPTETSRMRIIDVLRFPQGQVYFTVLDRVRV